MCSPIILLPFPKMSDRTYKKTLVRLMSYLDNIEYENDAEFTEQQLGELTPEKLMKWFNHETFDIPDPPVGHDLAPLVRTNTLKYWKKALSFFMPNCLMPWNALSGVGNPTRSKKIIGLIGYI